MEEWKLYSENPKFKYFISNFGNLKVMSSKTGNELNRKPQDNGHGYLKIAWQYVHRMVAETFIPNPENKLEVNHKDGNKRNNHFENLEWVTKSENMKHAYDNNLSPRQYGNSNAKGAIRSDETRQKLRESHLGVKLTEKHREKISLATKGENNPMYGRKQSEETKRKISEAAKLRNKKKMEEKQLCV